MTTQDIAQPEAKPDAVQPMTCRIRCRRCRKNVKWYKLHVKKLVATHVYVCRECAPEDIGGEVLVRKDQWAAFLDKHWPTGA